MFLTLDREHYLWIDFGRLARLEGRKWREIKSPWTV